MKEKIDLSLNRSLEELESSYWEFLEATEGVSTKTASGKIRLVRERLGLPRPVRKK